MENLIQRLDKWLRENRPDYYDHLLPGLTEEELKTFEEELGGNLPEAFKAFYRWKSGQQGTGYCLLPNLEWFGLEWIISGSKVAPVIKGDGYISWENNTIENWKDKTYPKWITFLTDGTALEYVLDMQGSFNGKPGQIISFWNDELETETICHENFYKWLETIILALEKGIFTGAEEDTMLGEYEEYRKLLAENNPGYPIFVWDKTSKEEFNS